MAKLKISQVQLTQLSQFICESFAQNEEEELIFLEKGYSQHDYFFKAKRKYSLLYTCNNWTNAGLKKMNIRTGIWTPFYQGVFYHLPLQNP